MVSNINSEKTIKIITYGINYSRKQIPKTDISYNVKRFPNPFREFPDHDGLDNIVKEWLLKYDSVERFIIEVVDYIEKYINKSNFEKPYMIISFSCYGGKHRSVVIAEEVVARLKEKGFKVEIEHLELKGIH